MRGDERKRIEVIRYTYTWPTGLYATPVRRSNDNLLQRCGFRSLPTANESADEAEVVAVVGDLIQRLQRRCDEQAC